MKNIQRAHRRDTSVAGLDRGLTPFICVSLLEDGFIFGPLYHSQADPNKMELNETGLSHSNPWPEHEGEQSLKGERAGTESSRLWERKVPRGAVPFCGPIR